MRHAIELDLTEGGILSPPLLRRLDRIAAEQIVPFNELMDSLSRGREKDIDWWCTGTAGRNNFVSPLFSWCVHLALIRELTGGGEMLRVLTDQPALAKTLANHAGVEVELRKNASSRNPLARAVHDIASCLFHALGSFAGAWLSRRRVQYPDRLILLDTFILRDSITEGVYRDRYYSGLMDHVSANEAQAIYYIPSFYRIRNYLKLFRQLRRAANFIPMQDFLTVGDFIFAAGHWLRLNRHKGRHAGFCGFDITALIDADLDKGRFRQSSFQALLSYRFWFRFPREHRIHRIVDWYEGQDIDHALCAAIRWHHPDISLVAFRPVCSKFEMSVFPAPHEVRLGVTPQYISAVGSGFAAEITAAVPESHVRVGPGLRYTRLPVICVADNQPPQILITLPLLASAIAGLRSMIDFLDPSILPPGTRWLIKRHPAMSETEVRVLFGDIPDNFSFVDGDYYKWLKESHLVMGLESSALLEAVAAGVPAICLARGNTPTKIPFPDWLTPALWRVCYDGPGLCAATLELLASKVAATDSNKLREYLLSPATRTATREMLGLD